MQKSSYRYRNRYFRIIRVKMTEGNISGVGKDGRKGWEKSFWSLRTKHQLRGPGLLVISVINWDKWHKVNLDIFRAYRCGKSASINRKWCWRIFSVWGIICHCWWSFSGRGISTVLFSYPLSLRKYKPFYDQIHT